MVILLGSRSIEHMSVEMDSVADLPFLPCLIFTECVFLVEEWATFPTTPPPVDPG
jgi:hypothetical protein